MHRRFILERTDSELNQSRIERVQKLQKQAAHSDTSISLEKIHKGPLKITVPTAVDSAVPTANGSLQ